ncbi:MAG: hypothetical protein CVV58_00230 [Tenericutes bacterium HGW-Tenericutes-3]|nr:MAG: hypothetical protein CVV58_00230 [Tenericutes bacterium HGW-Tenericutes-3]
MDLSEYVYKGDFGEIPLDEITFNVIPASITVTNGILEASEKGMFTLQFIVGETSIPINVFTKLAEETEYVIFSADYAGLVNGTLPEGYTINTGTAYISDGKLLVDGRATTPSRVLLPSYLNGFKNYIIETDFTILSTNEPTRWASVMFRFGATGYFQMAIRQGATATNGVEFAKWVNNGWNVPKTTSLSEAISSSSNYRLKIDLKGDVVKEYINDTLMISYDNASDFTSGGIGFQASGAISVYNNILITVPEDYIDNSSLEFTTIAELYEPETGIQIPPTAMQFVYSNNDILAMNEVVRPQVLVMSIDNSVNIVNPNSGIRVSNILDALKAIDGKVIPAFYIRNRDVAVEVATMLKSYGIRDVYLISRNTLAITDAREAYSMLRGILEIEYDSGTPVLSETDLLGIRDSANNCGALGVMLPKEYATKDNVEYLQTRLVSVITDASDGDDVDQFRGVMAGSNGVIVNDLTSLYDFYGNFPENSLIRMPLVIGHRGMSTKAPENTIEGSLLALEAGAHVIELDIYLTTDNEIIVIHDSTTTRTTNGTLTVEESSLEQLKALTILDNTGNFPNLKLPTLDEYFDTFKDEDVQIFIEIKSGKAEIIPALANLITEFDIRDQVTVITFNTTQIANMRTLIPNISVGYLNTSLSNVANLNGSVLSILNTIVPMKTTFNPSSNTISEDLVKQLNYRGITTWPWTINEVEALYSYYGMGVGGITTDYTWRMSNDWLEFEINEYNFTVDLANPQASISLRGYIETLKGMTYDYIPEFILVDDGGTGIEVSSNAIVTNFESTGTATFIVRFKSTFPNGAPYAIYDDLVTIKVIDSRLASNIIDQPAILALAVAPIIVTQTSMIFNKRKH